jgi:hypothetical protein
MAYLVTRQPHLAICVVVVGMLAVRYVHLRFCVVFIHMSCSFIPEVHCRKLCLSQVDTSWCRINGMVQYLGQRTMCRVVVFGFVSDMVCLRRL